MKSTRQSLLLHLGIAMMLSVVSGDTFAEINGRLQTVIDDVPVNKVPGIVLLVEGPDISFRGARGYADRKTHAPIKIEHSLRAGSVCKTYVAALAVMAEQDGLIDLDQTIDNYLGVKTLEQLPRGLRPTVRQLLNHTSGVPDYYGPRFYLRDWKDRGPLTTELVLHAIRGKNATSQPGTEFSYSNTNYHLAALILEAVHQTSLEALLHDRIFVPLELRATFYNQRFPPGDEIHGYGSPLRRWVDTFEWQENTGADGGIIASAEDLAIWIRALFSQQGDYAHIGELMTDNPVREQTRKYQGMGVEIMRSRSGVDVVGHTGGADGYLTAAFYNRSTDTVVVLHMNRSNNKIFGSVLSQVLRITM